MNILDIILDNYEFNKSVLMFSDKDIGYFNMFGNIIKISKKNGTRQVYSRKQFDYCMNKFNNLDINYIFCETIKLYDSNHETFHCFKNSNQFIDFINNINRDSIKFIQKIGDKLKLYKEKDDIRFFDLRENYELYILFNEHTDDFMIYDVSKINEIMKKG